ncbi:hypothetical protein AVEN_92617-1 [Araneus ventricosus]|uniref:Uncharacterized protein n=1 Tax=Araneus ventricosus TaxID=182803 RepID=A0A4Y2AI84_ARAVE|nr:hypothetical protein AVEN_92617-1 [Araneus ventricosus]
MQLHKLFGGQLLVVLLHKLIDIIGIHLQSLIMAKATISLTIDFTLHYCLRLLNNNILRPKLLPNRSENFLGHPFPCTFDHFEAGNVVEVLFLIFSESKVSP